jgi:hypothetical protein
MLVRGSLLAVLVVVSLCAAPAMSAPVFVANPSFETPSGATPFGVSTYIENWTTYGDQLFDTYTGGGPCSSGTGVFPNVNPDNSVNFSNANLNQVAYIFTKSSIAGNRDGLEQILAATYEAGKSYKFQIDVGLAGANPGATEPFTFNLFYYNPATPTARTIVGGRTIYNDAVTPLSKTQLTTLEVLTPILDAADAAVGKQIGIEMYTALGSDTSVVAGKQYIFDNVQLTQTPEPATLTALAAGVAWLVGRRSRRQVS